MPICSFCEKKFDYSGKMYILKSSKILYFCGSKCEKNAIGLRRKGRDTKWVTKKKKWFPKPIRQKTKTKTAMGL